MPISISCLAQPVVLAAAVEPVGDPALGRGVLLDVAVEQQQRHPADLGPPDVGACSVRPSGSGTVMTTAFPSASRSSFTGRPCGSSAG